MSYFFAAGRACAWAGTQVGGGLFRRACPEMYPSTCRKALVQAFSTDVSRWSSLPENVHAKARAVANNYRELEERLEAGEESQKLRKEIGTLRPIFEGSQKVREILTKVASSQQDIDREGDPELKELYQEDLNGYLDDLRECEDSLLSLLLSHQDGGVDNRNAILEIRAGTGGREAMLFVADMLDMYKGYASLQGWRVELGDCEPTEEGGLRAVAATLSGEGIFGRLKYESGVHRVQRVPLTETKGRVHTSAVSVAILPEATEVDVEVRESDLKIDTYRASGSGGQHVNTTDSAVRITHIPTGVIVANQDERSQHKNKAKAMKMLRSKLYEAELERAHAERYENRESQMGRGKRSERIRTYNYPQGRVTDHRIGLTVHNLPGVMTGEDLDGIINELDKWARIEAIEAI